MRADQIALQLYTVREHTARDFIGTLERLAGFGYRAVELAGYGGLAPRDLRAALDRLGLRAVAAHVRYDDFDTRLEGVVDELHALGCESAVVPSAPPERRGGADEARRLAETFNRWGGRCRAAGLRFGYHNHGFEFAPLDDRGTDGTTMFDLLVAETDPALVDLELDVYWAQHAGVDPVALIGRLAGRVPLLHVKDMAADAEHSDAPVGEGVLPWADILAAGDAAGARWYIVEQDHPRSPLEDVERSLRNLERMAGAGGA